MARCEDFPCCGHESGCCPDYDESGKQTNMVCTCGAKLPIDNRSSLCDTCLSQDEDGCYGDCEPDVDELTENQDFERADEYYGQEDYGDFGYEGCHEE